MDFDLEIISEEGDRPDPLFDSIMNAMNSMKEATADKIYQKIQKEGATNYSKPQVDRALASALKYGIFEVRNNRYRVRDDVLDDEDTVYWKFQNKTDQTPFRIKDDVNEKHHGPKLDPERDNQRFRRPLTKFEECPHCGRTKRQEFEGKHKMKKPSNQKVSSTKKKTKKEMYRSEGGPKKSLLNKRKDTNKNEEEKSAKRRKPNNLMDDNDKMLDELQDTAEETSDSSDPDLEELVALEHTQHNKSYQEKKGNFSEQNTGPKSAFSSECITSDLDIIKTKGSSISIKSEESDSEKTVASSALDQSPTRTADGFFEQHPCTSKNTTGRVRNQYLHSGKMYGNQYEKGQTDMSKGNPDWLEYSDEPQGAIIQSNNVLTIEPMDSLVFKNSEQASYIS